MNILNNVITGMMANMSIIMISLAPFTGCKSVHRVYTGKVKNEFIKQPTGSEEILTEKDIEHLLFLLENILNIQVLSGRVNLRMFT